MAWFHDFINNIYNGAAAVLRAVRESLTTIAPTGLGVLRRLGRYRRDRLTQEEQMLESTNNCDPEPSEIPKTQDASTMTEDASTITEEATPTQDASTMTEDASTITEEAAPAEDASTITEEAAPAEDASTITEEAAPAEDASTITEEAAPAEDASTITEEAAPAEDASTITEEAATTEDSPSITQEAAPTEDSIRITQEAEKTEDASMLTGEAAKTVELASESSKFTPGCGSSLQVLLYRSKGISLGVSLKHPSQSAELWQKVPMSEFQEEMKSASKALDRKIAKKFLHPVTAVEILEQSSLDTAADSLNHRPVDQRIAVTEGNQLHKEQASAQYKMQAEIDRTFGEIIQKCQVTLDKFKAKMLSPSKSIDTKIEEKAPTLPRKPKRRSYSWHNNELSTSSEDSSEGRRRRLSERRERRLRKPTLLFKYTEQPSKRTRHTSMKYLEFRKYPKPAGPGVVLNTGSEAAKEESVTSETNEASTSSKIMKTERHVRFGVKASEESIDKVPIVSETSTFPRSSKSVADSPKLKTSECTARYRSMQPPISFIRKPKRSEVESEVETSASAKPSDSDSLIASQRPETVAIATPLKTHEIDTETKAAQSSGSSERAFPRSSKSVAHSPKLKTSEPTARYRSMQRPIFFIRQPKRSEVMESEVETSTSAKPSDSNSLTAFQRPETAAITSPLKTQEIDTETKAAQCSGSSERADNLDLIQSNLESVGSLLPATALSTLPHQVLEVADLTKSKEPDVVISDSSTVGTSGDSCPEADRITIAESEPQELAELQSLSSAPEDHDEQEQDVLSSDGP